MALFLVTGGAGFIGSHITTALVERGHSVRVLDDLSGGRRENLEHLELGDPGSGRAVELYVGDVADATACNRAALGVHGIFHQAAQVSVPESVAEPVHSYQINVMGTMNLLEAARTHRVERFVLAASAAAYGNEPTLPKKETMPPDPQSPYASGKLAGEDLLKVYGALHGIQSVSLRYFNVFGPRQADDSPYSGVIAIFARRLLAGQPVTIFGDGEQTRDFTFVANVVSANMLCLDVQLPPGTVINVGAEERVSLNQLYHAMCRHLGSDAQPTYQEQRVGDVRHSVAAIARARELLGYEPKVSWQDGLSQTLEWYRGLRERN